MEGDDVQYARPATLNDLKALVLSLNEHGVEYLLIGGYALFAHGYQRATTDIDILVRPTVEDGEKVRAALLILPDKSAADIDPAWFEDGDTIRVADDIIVDVMFNSCGETFESLQKYAQEIDIDGIPVKTISLEGLLLTKQTVREKDVADRLILERAIAEMRKAENEQQLARNRLGLIGMSDPVMSYCSDTYKVNPDSSGRNAPKG